MSMLSRDPWGPGLTDDQVNDSIELLQQDFNSHGIYFQWNNYIHRIRDDYYFYFQSWNNDNIFCDLWNEQPHSDGIDLYFLPEEAEYNGARTPGIFSKAVIIGGIHPAYPGVLLSATSVVSHEIGHCLGLYHPHHGWGNPEPIVDLDCDGENLWDFDQCWEQYNTYPYSCDQTCIDNCLNCGDYVCDTSASENLWNLVDQVTCDYEGDAIDEFGNPIDPDTDNIMSYSNLYCTTNFTQEQIRALF